MTLKTKVNWFIEDYMADGSIQGLVDEIKRQGMRVELCKYYPYISNKVNAYSDEECVIFSGSLHMGLDIKRNKPWVPGVYFTPENYLCHNYYPLFGGHLFNINSIFLPYGLVPYHHETIRKMFGETFFMRPDDGKKTFTGQVVSLDNWFQDIMDLERCRTIEGNELVVISAAKNIDIEYRFIICNKEPIAASQYKLKGYHKESPNVPKEAYDYVKYFLKDFNQEPDKVWSMDVCFANGRYYILEIGCFSCCCLYACDLENVVRIVSDLAAKEWESYQEKGDLK